MYSRHLMESIYIEDDLRICRMSYILGMDAMYIRDASQILRTFFIHTMEIICTVEGLQLYDGCASYG